MATKLLNSLKKIEAKETKATYNVKLTKQEIKTLQDIASILNITQSDLLSLILKEQKIEETLKELQTENKTK